MGLVSALGQCSNGLERIMHSPSAHALSCPRPLLHALQFAIKILVMRCLPAVPQHVTLLADSNHAFSAARPQFCPLADANW